MEPTVLIADPEPLIAGLYCELLRSNGVRAERVDGGLACLGRLLRHRPDALVMDVDLPWANAVLTFLRGETDDHSPPIVLTGCEMDVDMRPMLRPPVIQYLQKPFDLTRLLAGIHACLRRNCADAPLVVNSTPSSRSSRTTP